eukprot:10414081-Alexandrium_andersonii.AAC.1
MSASLVGSEMCIRDRRPPGWLSACWWSAAGGLASPRIQESEASPPVEGPVSYTHLTLPTICSV